VNEDKLMRRMAKQDARSSVSIQRRNVAEHPTHVDRQTGLNVIIRTDCDQFRRPVVIFSNGSMLPWIEEKYGELADRFVPIKK